ncbi:hypothetical protein VTN00DRAFT_1757 [Thermoascus crustaceus]|uniref:uncharacterized protein n=1 Tax=Thermoascus crustaceus TaxID=5088 RepID=UPI00374409BF
MADGLNEARALRVAEIMNDYRTLQLHISEQKVDVPPEEAGEEGYRVMRECFAAAQSLLSSNFNLASIQSQGGNEETQKVQLQRIILDSSARRFQAHKIYLRIAAVRRWAINRAHVLRGQKPDACHAPRLQSANDLLREELANVTDQYVVSDLRAADIRAGHWLDEDPSLSIILSYIRSQS